MELDSMRRRACPFRKPGSIEAEKTSMPFSQTWLATVAGKSQPPRLPFYSRKAGCDLLPCPLKQKAAAAMQRGCWCRVARRIVVKFTLAMDGHVCVCVGVTVAKCPQAQRDISLAFCGSVGL